MSMSNPTISVVMAAYNVEKYIGEAIESVLAQSFHDWELIIVDDCSTDNTYKIARQYADRDSRIRLSQRIENSGGCRVPRFDAIKLARGEWICDMDADDVIEVDMFAKLLLRREQTSADMVLNRIVICEEDLKKSDRMLPDASFDMNMLISGHEAIRYTINGWKISVTCGLVNANAYEKCLEHYSETSSNGPFSDEIDRRRILLTANRIAFVDAQYYYRQQQKSIVHDCSLKSFAGICAMEELLEFIYCFVDGDVLLKQQMNIEYLNSLYRYQIKFFSNITRYDYCDKQQIQRDIRDAYRLIKQKNMVFDGLKLRLLASEYHIFKMISYITSIYQKYRDSRS